MWNTGRNVPMQRDFSPFDRTIICIGLGTATLIGLCYFDLI
ncbi:hypothetical protein AIOL_003125 [Candidatus Rhodobacter oscarellae]|uniref:Uncharacterized protein n=2 Tax=Candidatus Rhodobacter oscarellae TaxID=1675527 RepID=A0A0J9E915_9RHOB|nr:hypothetical protein AIOL_003125 [Candidatus Rhodobacter lobularis]